MRSKQVVSLILLGTLSSFGVGLLGPIYPIFVVDRFSASLIDLGTLYTILCLTVAIFKVPAGRLVDKYGKVRIFFIGVLLSALASLSYIFASEISHLYIIEFTFGLSAALQRPSLLSLMADVGGEGKRGMLFGLFESSYDIAEALAALLAAFIVSRLGFESLFIICSGCQATSGLLMLKSGRRLGQ
ncbi:MAG: MFS transporter [Candidatus Bathyarchaeia archaeon]